MTLAATPSQSLATPVEAANREAPRGLAANAEASPARQSGRHTLLLAASCLQQLAQELDERFDDLIEALARCDGAIVAAGVGKCRIVAEKFSGTLISSGTYSIPLCALEAPHGAMGLIRGIDVLVAFSNSGQSREIVDLAAHARQKGAKVLAITRSRHSDLGKLADFVVEIGSHPEAGAFALLPTTSSTAMMALGDAIAMALAERRGFDVSDLRANHPGGVLGQV